MLNLFIKKTCLHQVVLWFKKLLLLLLYLPLPLYRNPKLKNLSPSKTVYHIYSLVLKQYCKIWPLTRLDCSRLNLLWIALSVSLDSTCSGRALSPCRRLFRSLHSLYRVVWNAYLRHNLFCFSMPGAMINLTTASQLVEKELCRNPLVRCSQSWDEKEQSKKRWFLDSGALLHRTHVVSTPWHQPETRSIVANLSFIAIQAMKANFGVAWENQIPLPQVDGTPASLASCHVL